MISGLLKDSQRSPVGNRSKQWQQVKNNASSASACNDGCSTDENQKTQGNAFGAVSEMNTQHQTSPTSNISTLG